MAQISIAGDTSGSVSLVAPAVSGTTTLTLPTTTGNVVVDTATQTLTNKTLTSPVLTTPNLGTPSAVVLTNATGLSSAALPTGSVVQVIYASTTTAFNTASSTYVATPLTATIIKSFSSSKILILASPMLQAWSSGSPDGRAGGMIYDVTNSRQIIDFNCVARDYGSSTHVAAMNISLQAYDTNSGTGTRQYTFYTKLITGTDSRLNLDNNGDATSTMVLMEVVG
jgi:hypothetical protein